MVRKHILDTTEELWQRVQIYKISHRLRSNNITLIELIENSLDASEKKKPKVTE